LQNEDFKKKTTLDILLSQVSMRFSSISPVHWFFQLSIFMTFRRYYLS
jgi:hypothetical protein